MLSISRQNKVFITALGKHLPLIFSRQSVRHPLMVSEPQLSQSSLCLFLEHLTLTESLIKDSIGRGA